MGGQVRLSALRKGAAHSPGTRLGGGTQSRRQSWRQASRNADPKYHHLSPSYPGRTRSLMHLILGIDFLPGYLTQQHIKRPTC